jgi:ubiquinone/menaquinone biosynthesis C-methylase UbiE
MSTASYIPALGHAWLTNVYDPAMATIFQERLFRLPFVSTLDLQPGQRILDIGCGTGTLDFLLRKHAPDLLVVGLDIDPLVLTIAQRKAAQGNAPMPFALASADTLPYANGSFDQVVSSLMFHHLAAPQKAGMLAEARRVLRPGCRLSILDFGPPSASWLATLLTTVADGFEHIDDNLHGRVPKLLRQAGFVDVQVRDIAFGGLIKLYQGCKAGMK